MEELGYIEVKIEGTISGKAISPIDVDISDIKEMITDLETFLFPNRNEKTNRPHISYKIEEGSVKHKFFLPITSVLLFNGIIAEISKRKSIEFLDNKRAIVLEKFQRLSKEKSWVFSLTNSANESEKLEINKTTNFFKAKSDWVETELYLYGEIYTEGGLSSPNIHITSKEYGKLTVESTKEQLKSGENRLYKIHGLRVIAKQNLTDGKLHDIKLIDFIEYNPTFDKSELEILIKKTAGQWNDIKNVEEWISQIRGGIYE